MAESENVSEQLHAAADELEDLEDELVFGAGPDTLIAVTRVLSRVHGIAAAAMQTTVEAIVAGTSALPVSPADLPDGTGIPMSKLRPGMLERQDGQDLAYPVILDRRDDAREHMPAAAAAARLGYSRFHIAQNIRSGRIPGFGVRRRERVHWYAYQDTLAQIAIKGS